MRQFTPEEKRIMDDICSLEVLSEDIAISNLITKFCHCTIQWDDAGLDISYDKTKYSEQTVFDSLLTFICLLEYLEKESLIYVFQRTNIKNRRELINKRENHVKSENNEIFEQQLIPIEKDLKLSINGKTYLFGESATGIKPLSKTFVPWNVVNLVDRCAKSVLFCTETLRHFHSQGYQEDATIQYKSNRRQTWIAIGISLGIGFLNIVGVAITCCQNERHHKEIFSQEQTYVVVHDTIIKLEMPASQNTTGNLPTQTMEIDTIHLKFKDTLNLRNADYK